MKPVAAFDRRQRLCVIVLPGMAARSSRDSLPVGHSDGLYERQHPQVC